MRICFCCDAIYGENTQFDSVSFEDSAGNELCLDAEDIDFGYKDGKFFGRLKNCFFLDGGLDYVPELEEVWKMIPVEIDFY